ncbi:MAG: hypothetical protein J5J00_05005 [Deltaproteobacteria bacterium]|nr:hypothetical protein [Deltaproteobacteria bacterium]
MKICYLITATVLFNAVFINGVYAQDPALVLDPVTFNDNSLVVSYTTEPQVEFSGCNLKLRAANNKKHLQSSGLGKLVYQATKVNSDQFYAGLGAIMTDPLTQRPKGKATYFRVYLSCDGFVIKSNIESFNFSSSNLKKVGIGKWVKHVKKNIDFF